MLSKSLDNTTIWPEVIHVYLDCLISHIWCISLTKNEIHACFLNFFSLSLELSNWFNLYLANNRLFGYQSFVKRVIPGLGIYVTRTVLLEDNAASGRREWMFVVCSLVARNVAPLSCFDQKDRLNYKLTMTCGTLKPWSKNGLHQHNKEHHQANMQSPSSVTTIGNNNNNDCCNIRHTVACLPTGMASASECEKQQTSHQNKSRPALSIHTFDPPDNEHKHTQGSLRLSNNSLNCNNYEGKLNLCDYTPPPTTLPFGVFLKCIYFLFCFWHAAVTTKPNGLSSPGYRQIRTALAQSPNYHSPNTTNGHLNCQIRQRSTTLPHEVTVCWQTFTRFLQWVQRLKKQKKTKKCTCELMVHVSTGYKQMT